MTFSGGGKMIFVIQPKSYMLIIVFQATSNSKEAIEGLVRHLQAEKFYLKNLSFYYEEMLTADDKVAVSYNGTLEYAQKKCASSKRLCKYIVSYEIFDLQSFEGQIPQEFKALAAS